MQNKKYYSAINCIVCMRERHQGCEDQMVTLKILVLRFIIVMMIRSGSCSRSSSGFAISY